MVGGRDVNVPAAYQPHVPYVDAHIISALIYVNTKHSYRKCSH